MINNDDFEVKILLKFNNNLYILLFYINININLFNIK